MSSHATDPRTDPILYPDASERRFHVWIERRLLIAVVLLVVVPPVAAWVQYLVAGLPATTVVPLAGSATGAVIDFPWWLRAAHYLNFLLMILLMRSGLSILMDHPRLYRSNDCTIGTEWIRFTPVAERPSPAWTAKEDARYVTPLLALPGYRHTIGRARHWHFLPALLWFLNGVAFVLVLFATGEWARLVPGSWAIVPAAWADFVHYATLHIPPELGELPHYNALQQLSYFVVVFVMAPLSFLTALAMSPSLVGRFRWYAKLFGGRQSARSLHFLLLVGFTAFLFVHVAMVAVTGLSTNLNRIVLGSTDAGSLGLILALVGIAVVGTVAYAAHWTAWHHPRFSQRMQHVVHLGLMRKILFRHLEPRAEYSEDEISPQFWPNGKMPDSTEWHRLAATDFADYRLPITGLVENPVVLSLDDLRALGLHEQTTMHHCIQGWTGIASWGGVRMSTIIDLVKPTADAGTVVFRSFGLSLKGSEYYDTQAIDNVMHPQCILALEMNNEPLGHLYGAPVRLRVENQLGYKMVKWISAIEFVASEREVGKGFGGSNEDDEYFDLVPDI